MKYLMGILVLGSLLISTAICQTDTTAVPETGGMQTLEVMLTGGQAYPYLPLQFRRGWKASWTGGVNCGVSFDPGSLGYGALFLSLDYYNFKGKESGSAKSLTAMINFKGAFSPTKATIAPYFIIGLGYMYFTPDSMFIHPGEGTPEKSSFAWNVGVGVEFPVSENIFAFVQGRSVLGTYFRSGQYFPVNIGVLYRIL